MYLTVLVSAGVVGMICLISLFLTGIQCAASGRRKTEDPIRRHFGRALVAAIAVVAVTSATFDSISFPMVAGLTFLVLGVAGAYDGIMAAEKHASTLLAESDRPLVPG